MNNMAEILQELIDKYDVENQTFEKFIEENELSVNTLASIHARIEKNKEFINDLNMMLDRSF